MRIANEKFGGESRRKRESIARARCRKLHSWKYIAAVKGVDISLISTRGAIAPKKKRI